MTSLPLTFDTVIDYSMIQTFYADPEIVNNSGEVSITSVDLYFKNKPDPVKNVSGKQEPGVVVRICDVVNDEPVLSRVYASHLSRKSYNDIFSFSDASTATTFGFAKPLKLKTGRSYGIVISFEDPSYELWINKAGDRLIATNNASPGSNLVKDGKLYFRNNSSTFNEQAGADLKFSLNCAQYISNTVSEVYTNRDFEFFSVNAATGRFRGGEWVYQTVANAVGNVAFTTGTSFIIGTGTNFESTVVAGDRLVLWSNTTYKQVVPILNVVNNTYLETQVVIAHSNNQTKYMLPPSGRVHYYSSLAKKLYLKDSNANSSLRFQSNSNLIYSEDYGATATIASIDPFTVDRIRMKSDVMVPPSGSVNNAITFANYDGVNYTFSFNDVFSFDFNKPAMTNITKFDAYMLSRSLEVQNASLHTNTDLLIDRKSIIVNTAISINLSNNELYQSPTINQGDLDMFVIQNDISNTYTTTDANTVVIDTEVAGNGLAVARHIGNKVAFANNRFAEDIRVYMTAYRPANTEIKVYARVHNSADPEAFDDKSWTPLEYKENGSRFSSSDDQNDFVEFTLGLPQYSETANTLPGTFTIASSSSNTLTAAGVTPSTYLAVNDVVKLYNPLIPEDYIVGVVTVANTTAVQLGQAVGNNNVVGAGFKVDRLKYYHTAFNNITNDNVARYYNSSLVEFDKFNTMQVKVVMLSDTTYLVPKIDQIQVIGVSA